MEHLQAEVQPNVTETVASPPVFLGYALFPHSNNFIHNIITYFLWH